MASKWNKNGGVCSAFGCSRRRGTNLLSEVKMFSFPKDPERRIAWTNALKRENWTPTNNSLLCSAHFISGKPSKDKQHPDYVPSIFSFKSKPVKQGQKSIKRNERSVKRIRRNSVSETSSTNDELSCASINCTNTFGFTRRKHKMIRVELSVCQDLYIELAFTPKMTLFRSETGTLKFVPTSGETLSSLHNSRINSDEEESENPYQIESKDKIKCSPNPYSIESCSIEATSVCLEKLSEMMNRPFSDEKPLSVKSLVSTIDYRCRICKKPFNSQSGKYEHSIQCRKALEDLLNDIKPLESILLKPATKDGHCITDPSDNISLSHLKTDSLQCDKQDNGDSWTLATRTAAGTSDDPAYFFTKKFVLPKDLFNSLGTGRRNNSEQEEPKNLYRFDNKVSSLPPSSRDVDFTHINKPPVLSCTVDKKTTENHICKNCKISFKTSVGLYQHGLKCTKPLKIKTLIPTENYICKICKISFKTSIGLYKHELKCKKPLKIKISNKKFICARCNKSFRSYSGVYQHRLKCGTPSKAGKKEKVLKDDLLKELPELCSPIEIGQIMYPSDSLSTSLTDEDTLSCDSQDDKAILNWTIDEPATFKKRNLLQPQKGQSFSLDTSRGENSEVKFMNPNQFDKKPSQPLSSFKTKGMKFVSIIKNPANTN